MSGAVREATTRAKERSNELCCVVPGSGSVWVLPFDLFGKQGRGCFLPLPSLLMSQGCCIQGNDGGDTHTKELRYAFDFGLSVGTPVLAAADGVVISAVGCHRAGGRDTKEMRVRANYVALRHDCGLYTRYYHLAYNGVCVNVGDRVVAGMQIGRSGNTGFSGGPHLHFDVVDVLPTDTATLALESVVDGGGECHASRLQMQCVAGSFSATLPPLGAPVRARPVWADPPTACEPVLRNAAEAAGAIVVIDRCPDVDFIEKARRAEAAGAVGVIVVGNAETGAPFTMGMSKAEAKRRVGIPAIMVAHADGTAIRAALRVASRASADVPGGTSGPILELGCSPYFRPRCTLAEEEGADELASAELEAAATAARMGDPTSSSVAPALPIDKVMSEFVPITQPARFLWPGHEEPYLPRTGQRPPKLVQRAAAKYLKRDTAAGGMAMLGVDLDDVHDPMDEIAS